MKALADNYDLVIIDHPYMRSGTMLLPLDEHFTPVQLTMLAVAAPPSQGRRMALPVTAGFPPGADLLEAMVLTYRNLKGVKPRPISARF